MRYANFSGELLHSMFVPHYQETRKELRRDSSIRVSIHPSIDKSNLPLGLYPRISVLMNQIHIISARSMARQVVHGHGPLDSAMFGQMLVQLDVSVAGRTRQPHGSLLLARNARRRKRLGRRERLLPAAPSGRLAAGGQAGNPRADLFAEEVQHRPGDDGHAGADHAEVALEAAPERDVVVVVGRVGYLAEGGEVAEAHYAAGGGEEADEEGGDDAGFTPRVFDLQADELGDGEEEDDEVEEDVEGAVDVDCGFGDGTFAFVLAIPLKPEMRLRFWLASF
jgi:hypothetical protein